MTRDLESRLRAALHDHADEVTPARLTRTLEERLVALYEFHSDALAAAP